MSSEQPTYELMSALATLLEAGKYSDLTIVCGAKRYAVHRAIICSRSGFFDGACSNPFKEAETGIIDLSADDEKAVEHMINYFYHLDYLKKTPRSRSSSQRMSRPQSPISPVSPSRQRSRKLNLALVEDPLLAQAAANAHSRYANPLTPPDEVSNQFESIDLSSKHHLEPEYDEQVEEIDPFEHAFAEQVPDSTEPHLVTHAKVYAIAEKYNICGLKSLARKKFEMQMSQHWSSSEFPETILDVYDTTVDSDRGLRDIVVQTFRAHPELATRKDVGDAVKEIPSLAWELFQVGWGIPVR